MSLIFSLISIGLMSHVDFKKGSCRPIDFKGQGPPLPLEPGSSLPGAKVYTCLCSPRDGLAVGHI